MQNRRLTPVILSGGAGTRLWPLSREQYPKQLLPLVSEKSLLQETVLRLGLGGEGLEPPVVVCSADHRFAIDEQLHSVGVVPQSFILEPVPRSTAPAITAAALLLSAANPDAVMLVLPSDHAIDDATGLTAAVDTAARAAASGRLTVFAMSPDRPETGYGYLRCGAAVDGIPGVLSVAEFVEKPDLETALSYLCDGRWAWNSGMFVFPVGPYLEEMRRLQPALVSAVEDSLAQASTSGRYIHLDEHRFARAPAISVDYALMEHTDRAAAVPADIGWSDVGSWSALWDLTEKDPRANVIRGDVAAFDTNGCYLQADDTLVATLGLQDTVVVATGDVVLVAAKERAQDVKSVVAALSAADRREAISPGVVHRPWGTFQTVDRGPGHQVKHISVKPGHRLSLQTHARRAEHWVVVSGVAEATRGTDVVTLTEQMSIDIPVGCAHRLANPGPDWLHLVEVQIGDYLGEDDIVRLDDAYGRCRSGA